MQTSRKRISGAIIIVLAIAGAAYGAYAYFSRGSSETVRYRTAAATRGTLIVSVAGTGQVAATTQQDIKASVSGDLVFFPLADGAEVKKGQRIAQLDARDAARAVADAVTALETARLNLEVLRQPIDPLDMEQAENAVTTATRVLDRARDDQEQVRRDADQALTQAYVDAYAQIATTFLSIPDSMKDLQDTFGPVPGSALYIDRYRTVLGDESPFLSVLVDDYAVTLPMFTRTFEHFRTTPRTANPEVLYTLLQETITTVGSIERTLESARNMYDKLVSRDYKQLSFASTIDTLRTKVKTDIASVNATLATLQKTKVTIDDTLYNTPINEKNAREAVAAAEGTLHERTLSLEKLRRGIDPLDLRAGAITVQQKTDALRQAEEQRADYVVVAPFDAVVAKTNVHVGESVSAGTVLATLITQSRVAAIPLNEVDVAHVATGQSAVISFDAIEGKTFSGTVSSIGTLGETTQGVVTYPVSIVLDVDDARVRPGMSVSATIVTASRPDVFLVPSTAIDTKGRTPTVRMLVQGVPERRPVVVGLSNDTMTEVVSGIVEGDMVITQVIQATTTTAPAATQGSAFGLPTGGGVRIPGAGGGNGFRRNGD